MSESKKSRKAADELAEAKAAMGGIDPVAMPSPTVGGPPAGVPPVPADLQPSPAVGGVIKGAPHVPGLPALAAGAVAKPRARNPLFDPPDAELAAAGRLIGRLRQTLAGIAAGVDEAITVLGAIDASGRMDDACIREGVDRKALEDAVGELESWLDRRKPVEPVNDATE